MSSCIEWENKFSVGVKKIDDEHKMMVDLINQACDSAELMDAEEATAALLQNMKTYAENHFATEEALMLEYGFSAKNLHIQKHNLFRERVSAAIARGEKNVDPFNVFQFLRDWFHGHVLGDDKALGHFLNQQGVA